MNFMRWIPLVSLVALIFAFAGSLATGRDPSALPSPFADKPAPNFSLIDLSGNRRDSKEIFSKEITLINFFASWCVPCIAEAPVLHELSKQPGMQIVGIAYKDKMPSLQKFVKDSGNTFDAVLLDDTGRTGIDWGLTGVPETFLIDARGIVRYHYAGQLMQPELQEIKKLAGRLILE